VDRVLPEPRFVPARVAGGAFDEPETSGVGRFLVAGELREAHGHVRMADAVSDAEELGIRIEWTDDWMVGNHHEEYGQAYEEGEPSTCEQVTAYAPDGHVLDSVGCVDDADSGYRHEIENEVAAQALEQFANEQAGIMDRPSFAVGGHRRRAGRRIKGSVVAVTACHRVLHAGRVVVVDEVSPTHARVWLGSRREGTTSVSWHELRSLDGRSVVAAPAAPVNPKKPNPKATVPQGLDQAIDHMVEDNENQDDLEEKMLGVEMVAAHKAHMPLMASWSSRGGIGATLAGGIAEAAACGYCGGAVTNGTRFCSMRCSERADNYPYGG